MTRTVDGEHLVGQPIDRIDGPAKTTGGARFSAEHAYPGLTHAALVPATVSRGRITAIDTAAAAAVPGVITVLTHGNAPKLNPPKRPTPANLSTLVSGTQVNYLNTDEVHWDGQPVAVVVAETSHAAREAAALVHVSYERLPAVVDFAAEEPNAVAQKGNPVMPGSAKKGDADAALAVAPVTVDARYTTPQHHHNALEPHATTAVWQGDELTVHDSTQSITWLRKHLALRFGVPEAKVRVLAPFVGGGFGGKGFAWPGTIIAVLAARATGRPVRLLLTREDVHRAVGARTPSAQRVALGADTGGRLTALVHTSVTRTSRVGGQPEQVTAPAQHLYDATNIRTAQSQTTLDWMPNTSMRAPGDAIGSFALESAIDELAGELGIDPVELRMRNEPERNPIDGKRFSHRMLREAYALGARRFGWENRSPEPRSTRDGRWLVGMGVATAYHPAMQFTANVTVRLAADGTVTVRCGFQEMGMGNATVQAQIAADALGVPFEAVRVEYGDSALPASVMAGGSMQTSTVAGSVLAACGKLTRRLSTLARRTGMQGRTPTEILTAARVPFIDAAVGSDTRLGALAGQARMLAKVVRDQRTWAKAACGAHFCEVRVDADTGEVRVSRWTAAFDVGRVINRKTAFSQLRGGIVMGIGMALFEEALVDRRTGRIMNPSLSGYHVPVHADVPPIDIACLDEPDPTMPLGILGVGEVGITGVAAAIANAIHHATGSRIRDLPITPDKLVT
ncbi:xanthine dehydrogenase family protein molybdopterin-binding subunit [Prauserella muralis]|uniref:Carbon monoxide dehydrogenase n=1 Tax=Prauserella muralis TaxID=588067 RepID=A0A2V4AS13_9PSEU|nr:xanthine dehydrogenase family protein molybdopterin-binding subunit [Prauserella muralis]PXY22814.1 carbon monoxide dehydrogenase [Prauserella muralis]TWE28563.1 xanthine dehydrogenase YagR molybdenum-binding subunit [Prauserella muralis]